MHAPVTRETTRLTQPEPAHIGMSLDTPHHSLKVVYTRTPAVSRGNIPRRFCLGLILGALIMFGALGYGATLGGLVLAVIVVLAFYTAGRGD